MAFYTSDDIRNKLAVMERGKGVAFFNKVEVTFTPKGNFNIYCSNRLITATPSLKEAVKKIKIAL